MIISKPPLVQLPVLLPDENAVVRTRELTKDYRWRVLDRLELTVPRGAAYMLVGPNGAGKTTTLRILLDLVRPSSGEVRVFGLDPAREGARIRAGIGYVPEVQDFGHGWMRVRTLLEYHAGYFPTWDSAYAARLLRTLEVDTTSRFGKLSKGQARRVQLVMALAHRPPLLLLDEPTDGLDPVVRETVLSLLAEHLADSSPTLLLSTHHVHEAEGLADHVGVLREGRLVAQTAREDMDRMLRRYRARVPEGWDGPVPRTGMVLSRNGSPREIAWTVWGEEADVVEELRAAGADVHDVQALSLQDAAVTLLKVEV